MNFTEEEITYALFLLSDFVDVMTYESSKLDTALTIWTAIFQMNPEYLAIGFDESFYLPKVMIAQKDKDNIILVIEPYDFYETIYTRAAKFLSQKCGAHE